MERNRLGGREGGGLPQLFGGVGGGALTDRGVVLEERHDGRNVGRRSRLGGRSGLGRRL